MKVSTLVVIPAIAAVSLFFASTAYAGPDKNGEHCNCDHNDNPKPADPKPPGGGGHHGKNGGGKPHNVTNNGGGGGGGYIPRRRAQVVCVIDGQIVYVRRVQDCTYQPEVVVQYKPRKAKRVAKKARVIVQHADKNGGDSYVVMQQPHVQYYSPSSPAAVKQARKRAAAYGDGYYVQQQVVVPQYRKKRKVRYAQPIYLPAPDYSGVVIHYGPLVTKGGAY